MINWFRYSGIWITFVVNPLHWEFSYTANPTASEWPAPNRSEHVVQLLMFTVRVVVDNGDW